MRTRFFRDHKDRCWSVFHSTAEAIPPRRDDPARIFSGYVADVENDEAKPARV
jgi:hypothetical protein